MSDNVDKCIIQKLWAIINLDDDYKFRYDEKFPPLLLPSSFHSTLHPKTSNEWKRFPLTLQSSPYFSSPHPPTPPSLMSAGALMADYPLTAWTLQARTFSISMPRAPWASMKEHPDVTRSVHTCTPTYTYPLRRIRTIELYSYIAI